MRFELKLYHCTTGRPMSVPLDLDGVTEDWTPEQIGRELSIRLDCARKAKDATPPKAQRWGLWERHDGYWSEPHDDEVGEVHDVGPHGPIARAVFATEAEALAGLARRHDWGGNCYVPMPLDGSATERLTPKGPGELKSSLTLELDRVEAIAAERDKLRAELFDANMNLDAYRQCAAENTEAVRQLIARLDAALAESARRADVIVQLSAALARMEPRFADDRRGEYVLHQWVTR